MQRAGLRAACAVLLAGRMAESRLQALASGQGGGTCSCHPGPLLPPPLAMRLTSLPLSLATPRRRIPTSASSASVSGCCSEDEEEACGDDGGSVAAGSSARSDTCSSAYTCSTASTASTTSDSEDGDEACCKGSPTAGGAPAGLRRLAAATAAGGGAAASARGSVLQKQHALGEPTAPLFEYYEGERPHLRLPLHDQVLELAERCPELLTLDTRDLHPTSWLAVTWVPIYRVPGVPDPAASRDLQANFLTFHSLAVPAQRTHASPADLCSIAPLPPLLDPIGERREGLFGQVFAVH